MLCTLQRCHDQLAELVDRTAAFVCHIIVQITLQTVLLFHIACKHDTAKLLNEIFYLIAVWKSSVFDRPQQVVLCVILFDVRDCLI